MLHLRQHPHQGHLNLGQGVIQPLRLHISTRRYSALMLPSSKHDLHLYKCMYLVFIFFFIMFFCMHAAWSHAKGLRSCPCGHLHRTDLHHCTYVHVALKCSGFAVQCNPNGSLDLYLYGAVARPGMLPLGAALQCRQLLNRTVPVLGLVLTLGPDTILELDSIGRCTTMQAVT